MEWIRDCFKLATKIHLEGEYRILIVDGHASHVTNDFIKFTQEYKIV